MDINQTEKFIKILQDMSHQLIKYFKDDDGKSEGNHTLRLVHANIISAYQLLAEYKKERKMEGGINV